MCVHCVMCVHVCLLLVQRVQSMHAPPDMPPLCRVVDHPAMQQLDKLSPPLCLPIMNNKVLIQQAFGCAHRTTCS